VELRASSDGCDALLSFKLRIRDIYRNFHGSIILTTKIEF